MHYVIGDVHGCFDELMKLIKIIEDRDVHARYIFLGDFIDRGPKVGDTLKWAMENITLGGKFECVRGNHEQMVLDWYEDWRDWKAAEEYAGLGRSMPETHYDFSEWLRKMNYLTEEKLDPIMRFFRNMPYSRTYTINGINYKIVHAWFDFYETSRKRQQLTNIWKRHYTGNWQTDDIVIHGHTPTLNPDFSFADERNCGPRPGIIDYRKNAINLDSGCVYGGSYPYPCMLSAICLETLEEIYHCTLEERYLELHADWTLDDAKHEADEYREMFLREDNIYRKAIMKRLPENGGNKMIS